MEVYPHRTLRLPGSVVTVGTFGGVHRGHQALIGRVADRARELGVPAVAYTFDPPPLAYFQEAPVLAPLGRKIRQLRTLVPK
ncbi:MAG: hypothetical protein AB1425_00720 [Actinomycetota bacterium]